MPLRGQPHRPHPQMPLPRQFGRQVGRHEGNQPLRLAAAAPAAAPATAPAPATRAAIAAAATVGQGLQVGLQCAVAETGQLFNAEQRHGHGHGLAGSGLWLVLCDAHGGLQLGQQAAAPARSPYLGATAQPNHTKLTRCE